MQIAYVFSAMLLNVQFNILIRLNSDIYTFFLQLINNSDGLKYDAIRWESPHKFNISSKCFISTASLRQVSLVGYSKINDELGLEVY